MEKMKAATLLLALMALGSGESKSLQNTCGQQPADVVFVLDVSSSIWVKDFKDHVLTFVQAVVKELDVGPGQSHTRVAAVTFSSRVKLEFYLHQYLNKDRLQKRVARIQSRGGNTDTHEALQFVDQYVFQATRGARTNVSRVVVIITDGASHKAQATADAARALRDHGATIFAIGVGHSRDAAQLADMASRPPHRYVFEVTNFQALDSIKDKLVHNACEVQPTTTTTTTTTTEATSPSTTTTTTATPTTPSTITTTTTPSTTTITATSQASSSTTIGEMVSSTEADFHLNDSPQDKEDTETCISRPADVYFVLDSTSSILAHHFHGAMLTFVRDVINRFDVGRQHTRVGVITFSDVAQTVFGLHSHLHKDELLKAVSQHNIQYRPGRTNTADALQLAGRNFAQEGRRGVQQVLVLITDGQSVDPNKTVSTARALRQRGVRVMVVGVGEGVDSGELQAVTGDHSVMMVEDFESLPQLSSLLAARSCQPHSPDISDVPGPDDFPLADSTPRRCGLRQADMVVVYDWQMLGAVVTSRLTTTLHHLANALHARSCDLSLGTMTSTICIQHQTTPLSHEQVWSQYRQDVTHSQLPAVLKRARRYAFSPANGHRPTASKVMLLVLDPATDPTLPRLLKEASRARRNKVQLFFLTSRHQEGLMRQGVRDVGHLIQLPDLTFANPVLTSDVIGRSLCADTSPGTTRRYYRP